MACDAPPGVQTRGARRLTSSLRILSGELHVEPQLLLQVRIIAAPAQRAE
jgi:hypothetical protein